MGTLRLLLGVAGLLLVCWAAPAQAQQVLICYGVAGQGPCQAVTSTTPLPVTGSFSASLGGFRPVSTGTPILVTTGGVTGALPTNTGEVVASNPGTTNIAYCKLGASATTSDQPIAPNGGWFGFAISGDTQLTCITSTSTTTVNMVGGSGLPTGTGGGGGGSGGSVTQGTTPWVDNITTWAGGTLGAMANYGTSPGAVLVPGVNAFITNATPGLANNADGIAAVAASSSSPVPVNNYCYLFNATTWDRCRSGTTTGSTLINGAGTAGSPAGGVETIQGASGMTPVLTNLQAATGGGATPYTPFVPTASDNHQVIKNGAGTSFSITTSNNSATKNYLRLYDAGTGFNGCNSATGVIFAMEIPPNDSGFTVLTGGVNGLAFSTGLSICVTSGFGLTDTTNATATAMYINPAYK